MIEWAKRLTPLPGGRAIDLGIIVEDAAAAAQYRAALLALDIPPAEALALTVAYVHARGVAKMKIEIPPETPEKREGWQG